METSTTVTRTDSGDPADHAGEPRTAKPASVIIDAQYYDAVLFDLDGVVTDTASVHSRAWTDLFNGFLAERPAQHGEDHSSFTMDDYLNLNLNLVGGKPRADGIADFLSARGISLPVGLQTDTGGDTICGLAASKQYHFERLLEAGLTVFDSTVALVRDLGEFGFGVALFTSSRNCCRVLHATGLDDLFTVRVDGTDAEALGLPGKPNPAVLFEAARRLCVRPDRCVVVDDAQSGVTAGHDGGFRMVIGVARADGLDVKLRSAGADFVVHDLAEVTVRGPHRLAVKRLPSARIRNSWSQSA